MSYPERLKGPETPTLPTDKTDTTHRQPGFVGSVGLAPARIRHEDAAPRPLTFLLEFHLKP